MEDQEEDGRIIFEMKALIIASLEIDGDEVLNYINN
jgi:hypothetical protein